jgi:transcriptional regulator with XRE-family HTH domain
VPKKKKQKPFSARFPVRESAALEVLARNVQDLRKALGLSQTRLAASVEIDQNEVSKIENARANPTILLLERLADALGVSLPDLFIAGAAARSTKGK